MNERAMQQATDFRKDTHYVCGRQVERKQVPGSDISIMRQTAVLLVTCKFLWQAIWGMTECGFHFFLNNADVSPNIFVTKSYRSLSVHTVNPADTGIPRDVFRLKTVLRLTKVRYLLSKVLHNTCPMYSRSNTCHVMCRNTPHIIIDPHLSVQKYHKMCTRNPLNDLKDETCRLIWRHHTAVMCCPLTDIELVHWLDRKLGTALSLSCCLPQPQGCAAVPSQGVHEQASSFCFNVLSMDTFKGLLFKNI